MLGFPGYVLSIDTDSDNFTQWNTSTRFCGQIGSANIQTSDNIVASLGSFGRVMLAKNKKSGDFFAMKRLKKADIIKLRQVDHVISENTILADIDHPFLVSDRLH